MKSLIITVAGTATRFNRDTDEETLKCLYHKESPRFSLLSQIIYKSQDIDEFIIVGGYLFDKLRTFIDINLSQYIHKIKLVYNPEYRNFGSGYSLIKGIESVDEKSSEVVFVEGDLYFDESDFEWIKKSRLNVFTINGEPITADKAVAVYERTDGHIQYLYDTSHKYLSINEPFLAIYNSGQIWKFTDIDRLRTVVSGLSTEQRKGTNLEIIQGYFGALDKDLYEMIRISIWCNCNTVNDYNSVFKIMKQ